MDTKHSSTAQGAQVGTPDYERRDASAPWIFGVVVVLICSGIVIQWVLAGVLKHLLRLPTATDAWQRQPQAVQPATPVSFPKLQVSAPLDLAQFRAREDEELTNYGWINRTAGIVRVPIERAMELVLQKGLPGGTNGAGLSPAQLIEKRVPSPAPNGQRP